MVQRNENDHRVVFCHLQTKVNPSLQFNDGKLITVSRASCRAHCAHGDQPMPVPLDNDGHPNRQCARIHIANGLPECEVNTPSLDLCGLEACLERCNFQEAPFLENPEETEEAEEPLPEDTKDHNLRG